MLCLHNWGGTGAIGAPDPVQVADRYDVVAISVDYLQSDKWDASAGIPYDFGYLQALDALRALNYVFQSLDNAKTPFARGRIYATGGSGGGNVALMANKLAPRTFACVVDISGMAKLTDDIAYGLPGGSELNAGYSQDKSAKAYLSLDAQALRDIGNPDHLFAAYAMGNRAKIIVVHGVNDPVCPPEDVVRMAKNFEQFDMDVDLHLISKKNIDGDVFKDSKHSLGDRTKILFKFGDRYMKPGSRWMRVRKGKSEFEEVLPPGQASVIYPTQNGVFTISFSDDGMPVGEFVNSAAK
jgi:predicted esterase